MNLYGEYAGVPMHRPPVFWDITKSVGDNLKTVDRWIGHYDRHMPPFTQIDEAAILLPHEGAYPDLWEHLASGGWEIFNTAKDVVYTNPFSTRYCVDYHFFSNGAANYRLEVMVLTPDSEGLVGFSPLHEGLLRGGLRTPGRYPMPHLSFKPMRLEDQTWRKAYGQAVNYLRDHAAIHAMSCQSRYGQFGYYLGNETARQIYLKPRINLRDEA